MLCWERFTKSRWPTSRNIHRHLFSVFSREHVSFQSTMFDGLKLSEVCYFRYIHLNIVHFPSTMQTIRPFGQVQVIGNNQTIFFSSGCDFFLQIPLM